MRLSTISSLSQPSLLLHASQSTSWPTLHKSAIKSGHVSQHNVQTQNRRAVSVSTSLRETQRDSEAASVTVSDSETNHGNYILITNHFWVYHMTRRNLKDDGRWICSPFVSAGVILPSMKAEYENI